MGWEYIEANPLPEVCRNCIEPDCDVCDHGKERWLLPPEVEHELRQKLRQQQLRKVAGDIAFFGGL